MKPQTIAENAKISPFLVFYLIISMQIGLGILRYQRVIAKAAGYDSWISVLVAGLSVHVIIWMIYKITETVDGDLFQAHQYVFGNILAKFLSMLFIFYFCLLAITVVRSFVEVVQVWMFPDINTFWFSLAFFILCIYIIFGGFRTVTGIAFLGTILPSLLSFTFAYTIPFSDFTNIFPLFDHSLKELGKAYFDMTLTYAGYETLLFFYPFIKDPQKSKKWAHLAVFLTTLIYTFFALLTFAYFSEKQLQETIWPTLNMWKIVEMPFAERFEYIGIASWNLFILPKICICLWITSRLTKQIFHIRQRRGVILISIICLAISSLFTTRIQINFLTEWAGKMSFLFNYLYIPFIFIAVMIAKKVKSSG